jgi:ABC-type uncharacterized transport system involved in gliding motility auxiliary subunit
MIRRASLLSASNRGILQLALQVGLALALVCVLQFLAGRHNVRFDLTPTKAFLLSPFSVQVAESFDGNAEITAFYDGQAGGERRRMLDIFQQFEDANHRLAFHLVDLDRSPGLAEKFGVSGYNSGVITADDRRLEIRSISEQEIVSALLKLSRAEPTAVCFITGHGEHSPRDANERSGLTLFAKSIEREHFAVRTLRTIPATGVPSSCGLVVIAGPSHDLIAGEAEALGNYLRGGGRALILIEPQTPASFVAFLSEFGIEAGNNIIVDEANRMIGADSFVVQVIRFRPDVFKDRLRAAAILPVARTIHAAAERPPGVRIISIAGTSPESWARQGSTEIPDQSVRFRRELDEPGPLAIAVLADIEPADADAARGGQLMVFGDSDFATNLHFETLGNQDLITAAVAVLAEEPILIGAGKAQRPESVPPLVLTNQQTRTIFWVAFVILPGSSLLIGSVIGVMRRRQRGGR